ncbi:MAG TPA: DNA-directed DNA polymerase [Thermoproteota archaeon]|nr:DNA-directed DNA polymerase [Thermoproteota archaeon]
MSKSTRFWLVDVNDGEFDGQRSIFLWGIDKDGRRVLLLDRDFRPSFYLLLNDQAKSESILKQLADISSEIGLVADLSMETKKLLGRERGAIRVRYSDTSKAQKLAARALRLKGLESALELDIRPSQLYLLGGEAVPCSWHEAEVSEVTGSHGYAVSRVYYLDGRPKRRDDSAHPQLRVLAFYVVCAASKGTPDPRRDPVLAISIRTEKGVRSFTTEKGDDSDLLAAFTSAIRREDPDIVVGFRCNSRDWSYLTSRASLHGLNLNISRAMTKPHPSIFGHFSITGRLDVDLSDLMHDVPEIESDTLEALATYFGASPEKGFLPLDEFSVSSSWANEQRRAEATKAAEQRAHALYDVCSKAMDFILQLSSLTRLPGDHVLTAAVGFRVDTYLMSEAKKRGELIPPREERPYLPYAGGLVMDPTPGIHRQVAVVDFRSMYPNIMITYNVSPETLVRTGSSPSGDVNVSPEGGHKFVRRPRGFLPSALLDLMAERKEIERLAGEARSEPEIRFIQARDKALKVISNATYGYTGWLGARWYSKEVAESTTAWGRSLITKASEIAKGLGLLIIYGDTDSLFVSHDEKRTKELLQRIEKELGFDVRVENIYSMVVFTEAKKRYAGMTDEGKLDIVGLEAVRSDWSEVARQAQRKILGVLLSGGSKKAARDALDEIVSGVRSGRVPLEDFVLWKTITKPLSEYTVRTPHVEAARMLEERGWIIKPGDRVGYLVTRATKITGSRVSPYRFTSVEQVDKEYYVEEQILPACNRVLEVVGTES